MSDSAAVTLNVLANDTDADGSLVASSLNVVTNPVHGCVTVNAAGSVTYTPSAGYSGQDSFAYTVTDNQGAVSAPAQVTVTVTPTVTVTGGSGSKSGGGGALGYAEVAVLLVFAGSELRRRRRGADR